MYSCTDNVAHTHRCRQVLILLTCRGAPMGTRYDKLLPASSGGGLVLAAPTVWRHSPAAPPAGGIHSLQAGESVSTTGNHAGRARPAPSTYRYPTSRSPTLSPCPDSSRTRPTSLTELEETPSRDPAPRRPRRMGRCLAARQPEGHYSTQPDRFPVKTAFSDGARWPAGNTSVKTVCPRRDSTAMRPPISAARSRAIASPSPLPEATAPSTR